MRFEETVPFDPGFNAKLENLFFNIKYGYEQINVMKNFNQRKFQFHKFYPIFKKNCEYYVSFYIGCLLWALILKKQGDKEITGNLAYGKNYTEEETLIQLNCLRATLPQLEKDTKYYLNKAIKFDEDFYEIIDIYEEFIKANKLFNDIKTTNDIVISFKYTEPNYEEVIKTIETVTETGNFSLLYSYKNLFLDCPV